MKSKRSIDAVTVEPVIGRLDWDVRAWIYHYISTKNAKKLILQICYHSVSAAYSTVRIGLRNIAFRVLAKPPTSLAYRSRSINTITAFTHRNASPRLPISQLQRRFASEEAQTQSEPTADREAEGQHGENSIAASSQENEPSQMPQAAAADAPPSRSAQSEEPTTVGELASAAEEKVKGFATDNFAALGAATGSGYKGSPGNANATPNPTVYVGNLFFDVREEDLKQEFEKIAKVETVKLILDARGLSKGFGYVTFSSTDSATAAIEALHDQVFEGRRLTVQYSTGRARAAARTFNEQSPPSRTLFIGNMAFNMSDKELNDLFRNIRNVVDVRVAIDRRTGQPRGFAHADFTDVESAKEAMIELAGKEICGRNLRVDFSQAMQVRQREPASGSGEEGGY
ncbi:MAG: hypothetical protein Q9219_003189 [cf. Caloplaca sp. 3 TL-2023]